MYNPFRRRPALVGDLDIITGRILLVDPAWLSEDVLNELQATGDGAIVDVDGDGSYEVYRFPDGSILID